MSPSECHQDGPECHRNRNICQCKYVNESLKLPANIISQLVYQDRFHVHWTFDLPGRSYDHSSTILQRSHDPKRQKLPRYSRGKTVIYVQNEFENENIFSWVPLNRATWPSFKLKRLLWSIKTFNKQLLPIKNSHRDTTRDRDSPTSKDSMISVGPPWNFVLVHVRSGPQIFKFSRSAYGPVLESQCRTFIVKNSRELTAVITCRKNMTLKRKCSDWTQFCLVRT